MATHNKHTGQDRPEEHSIGDEMSFLDRIATDPSVLDGQPHIRGTRVTVRRIVEALIIQRNCKRLLDQHPELEPDDMRAAAEFAALHFGPAAA